MVSRQRLRAAGHCEASVEVVDTFVCSIAVAAGELDDGFAAALHSHDAREVVFLLALFELRQINVHHAILARCRPAVAQGFSV